MPFLNTAPKTIPTIHFDIVRHFFHVESQSYLLHTNLRFPGYAVVAAETFGIPSAAEVFFCIDWLKPSSVYQLYTLNPKSFLIKRWTDWWFISNYFLSFLVETAHIRRSRSLTTLIIFSAYGYRPLTFFVILLKPAYNTCPAFFQ